MAKIEGVELTPEHIGAAVVYLTPHSPPEKGVVSSFDAVHVWVRFRSCTGELSPVENLRWECLKPAHAGRVES